MLRRWKTRLYQRRLSRTLIKAERQLIDLEIEINRVGELDAIFEGSGFIGVQNRNRLDYLVKLHERYTRSFEAAMETLERSRQK